MTEGPIGKYEIMMPRLVEGHSFNFERDAQAVMRIFWGMFKKMVIADRANLFVTGVFDNGDQAGSMVLLGTLLYTVQIYCEFSGCMDIVCATGQLFGVEMQENFRRPIFSKTINEFLAAVAHYPGRVDQGVCVLLRVPVQGADEFK